MNHAPSDPADESDETTDALQRELQSMTPRGLSNSVRRQIDQSIIETQLPTRSPIRHIILLAVAASVLFLFGWFAGKPERNAEINVAEQRHDTGSVESNQDKPGPRFDLAEIHDDIFAPTHLGYRRAAEKSYDDLDELLAHHGGSSMGGNTPPWLAASD